MTLRRTPAERLPVDLLAMKMEARYLEEGGNVREALALYRDILTHLEPKPVTDQTLPFYLKVGELARRMGDASLAGTTLLKGADRFAKAGDAGSVGELCLHILRVDPGRKDVYAQFARRMLDYGHAEPARQLLLDYARRARSANLGKVLTQMERWPKEDLQRLLTDFLDRIVPEERRRRRSSDHRRRPSEAIREADRVTADDPTTIEPEPMSLPPDTLSFEDAPDSVVASASPVAGKFAPVEPEPEPTYSADVGDADDEDLVIEKSADPTPPATAPPDVERPDAIAHAVAEPDGDEAEPEEEVETEEAPPDAEQVAAQADDPHPAARRQTDDVAADEPKDQPESVPAEPMPDAKPMAEAAVPAWDSGAEAGEVAADDSASSVTDAQTPSEEDVPDWDAGSETDDIVSEQSPPAATDAETPVEEPAPDWDSGSEGDEVVPEDVAAAVAVSAEEVTLGPADVQPTISREGDVEEPVTGRRRRVPVVLLVPAGIAAVAGAVLFSIGRSEDSRPTEPVPAAVTASTPAPQDAEPEETLVAAPAADQPVQSTPDPDDAPNSVARQDPTPTQDAPEAEGETPPEAIAERPSQPAAPPPAAAEPSVIAAAARPDSQPTPPQDQAAADEPAAEATDAIPVEAESDNVIPDGADLGEPTAVVDGLRILEIAPLDTPTGRGYRILQLVGAADTLQLTVVSLGSGVTGQAGRVRVRESGGSSIGTTRFAQYLVTARAALPAAEIESLLNRLVEVSPDSGR